MVIVNKKEDGSIEGVSLADMIYNAQVFTAEHGRKPTIIMGRDYLNVYKYDSIHLEKDYDPNNYVAKFCGYNCKEGDFETGYYLE